MRVALYARVSTDEQDPNNQLSPLRAYSERHGWTSIEFTDRVSGARSYRPGLTALKQAVARREIDIVLITKLDRLGRSTIDLLTTLEEFEARGFDSSPWTKR